MTNPTNEIVAQHPKTVARKFSIETPYGTFTRSTHNQYECISVWEKPSEPGKYLDSWHHERANVSKSQYSRWYTLVGVYDVPQLTAEEWQSKRPSKKAEGHA